MISMQGGWIVLKKARIVSDKKKEYIYCKKVGWCKLGIGTNFAGPAGRTYDRGMRAQKDLIGCQGTKSKILCLKGKKNFDRME